MSEKQITIKCDLSDAEALALAQFMKRLGWTDWRVKAVDDDEAFDMRNACEKLADSLGEAGYRPR
jgi:hypothetical protein